MSNLIGQYLGRYHILEQLGEGGMATVYKAFDPELQRNVAIKVILPLRRQSETLLRRFKREARALAKLTHPNIVKIIDIGEFGGLPYIVMEYVEGGTLKQRIGKPVPWQDAIQMVLPIAQALEYIHQKKIIHRDIKPSNILLNEAGEPLLSDFGIAKLTSEEDETVELTGTGAGVGTPEYMAPEQFQARGVDARADIYALGVVLFELVTGRKPFQAETPAAVIWKKAVEPLPNPSDFVRGLPGPVEKIILKATATKPAERYQQITEMITALEKALPRPVEQVVRSAKAGPAGTRQTTANQDKNTERQSLQQSSHTPRTTLFKYWPFALAFLVGIALLGTLLSWVARDGLTAQFLAGMPPETRATQTLTLVFSTTNTPFSTFAQAHTLTPVTTKTPLATSTTAITAASMLGIGSTLAREKDDMVMVYVLEGPFTMGSETGGKEQRPVHQVTLDAFWIDQTEVTNAMFALCVQAGACQPPRINNSRTRNNYYRNAQYAQYPRVNVTWSEAEVYCEWVGGRLPSEAEWEKAARGTDGRTYPWGDGFDCSKANGHGCKSDTTEVGKYESGKSPYGAYDMAGNVWEWVADWYSENYYSSSPVNNPSGPASGTYRVMRGGSWGEPSGLASSAERWTLGPSNASSILGFRCAQSVTLEAQPTVPAATLTSTPAIQNSPVPSATVQLGGLDLGALKTITLDNLTQLRELAFMDLEEPVAVEPNHLLLATGKDNEITIWNLLNQSPITSFKNQLVSSKKLESQLAFSADGNLLAVGKRTGTIQVLEVKTGKIISTINDPTPGFNNAFIMVFSPDGKTLAVTSFTDRTSVNLWDVPSGARIRTLSGHSALINGILLTPQGDRIITAAGDGLAKIWAKDGTRLRTIKYDVNPIDGISLSPDGIELAIYYDNGVIRIWDLEKGTLVKTYAGASAPVYSPDGQLMVMASGQADLAVSGTYTDQPEVDLATRGGAYGSSPYGWSTDGKLLISAFLDSEGAFVKGIQIWGVP